MMKTVAVILAALIAIPAARAEVPVFSDGVLKLESAAVYQDGMLRYFSDVSFDMGTDGSFHLLRAKINTLANIETADVLFTVSSGSAEPELQASAVASGSLTVACESLLEPAVFMTGDTVYVLLAESLPEKDEVCMSVVAVTHFETQVPLSGLSLEAGHAYTLNVNGLEKSFTVPEL